MFVLEKYILDHFKAPSIAADVQTELFQYFDNQKDLKKLRELQGYTTITKPIFQKPNLSVMKRNRKLKLLCWLKISNSFRFIFDFLQWRWTELKDLLI